MGKLMRQWTYPVPWGNIALYSYGVHTNPPMLFIHGFQDTSASFIPLIEALPDTHFYVGLDLPGHGLSDSFPPGLMPTQTNYMKAIHTVVSRMKWESFIYVGHSMGCILGVMFNAVYPRLVGKFIYLDMATALALYSYIDEYSFTIQYFYNDYFYKSKYSREKEVSRVMVNYEELIQKVVKDRMLSKEQAEVSLCRSLQPEGNDMFSLKSDRKLRLFNYQTMSLETFEHILTHHVPVLHLFATHTKCEQALIEWAKEILDKSLAENCDAVNVPVNGHHDFFIDNVEACVKAINSFLMPNSKL